MTKLHRVASALLQAALSPLHVCSGEGAMCMPVPIPRLLRPHQDNHVKHNPNRKAAREHRLHALRTKRVDSMALM